jgi:hypothetical protein
LYLSLFFASRARALCLSFSSSFADDNAPGWRRRFGDALDDDDENQRLLNVCVDVQKDRPKDDLSPGQTRFFLYLL